MRRRRRGLDTAPSRVDVAHSSGACVAWTGSPTRVGVAHCGGAGMAWTGPLDVSASPTASAPARPGPGPLARVSAAHSAGAGVAWTGPSRRVGVA